MRQASTAGSQIPGFSLFDDDELYMPQNRPHVQQQDCTHVQSNPHVQPQPYPVQSKPIVQPQRCTPVHTQSCPPVQPPKNTAPSTASSSRTAKPSRISRIDETLICGDDLLEDMFKEDPANIPDSWASEDDDDPGSDASIPADIDDIPVRGYDQDFWAPLLDSHLGGSDAAEVMAGISVPKIAPHIIHCTTGDAFDHTILVSGELPPYTKPELAISELTIGPPRTRRPSGRPKESRIPSTEEIPPAKKTKPIPNRCTRCLGTGHNRTRCVCPI
ncbi:SWIM-type domain-containing protein [Raphanus sativus]|nr:SWIM-type domain-containing protein [Raphanus sativus]